MKYLLSISLAAYLFIACNSGKDKTASATNDSATTGNIISPDPNYQATAVIDTTPVSTSRLIIPGKSIGLTSIDQKNAEAMKHLGPAASEDAGMGKELAIWYSKPLLNGTDTVINETDIFFTTNMGGPDEASRVSHIRITSRFFVTSQRIGTGTGMDTIQKYFPGIKKIASYISPKTKKEVLIYDENHSGIAFEIDQQHTCVAITVHKPGEEAHETYNALFGDVKFFE